MKHTFLMLCTVLSLVACSGAKNASGGNTSTSKSNIAPSEDYGYSEKNPVKVGGVNEGPVNERAYLNSLTGPNGEPVTYVRRGSCCMFETKNSDFGGMLDKYEVTIQGDSVKKVLYLNMYDKDKLYAPKGFLLK